MIKNTIENTIKEAQQGFQIRILIGVGTITIGLAIAAFNYLTIGPLGLLVSIPALIAGGAIFWMVRRDQKKLYDQIRQYKMPS